MVAVRREYEEVDAADIRGGMNVYGMDGENLGTIAEVWIEIPGHGYVAKSHFELNNYGPIRGTTDMVRGADGYVQVREGMGMRYEHEEDLFIPLTAILDVDPNDSISAGRDGSYRTNHRRAPGLRLK